MIKLTVDPQVLISLQQAFPTPVNSAFRALNKYLAAIEGLIFNAIQRGITPEQRKLKLFAIPLHELANRGGRIGKGKIRLHKWLKENKLEIVQKVENGDKFRGEYSLVKLSKLAAISGHLTVSAKQIDEIKSDGELDRYLTGDASDNLAVFKHLYPELDSTHQVQEMLGQFDIAPIDIESLKAFIIWLSDRENVAASDKLAQSLIQAKTILAVAAVTGGIYPQRRKPSPFGRTYYEGVSVQNVHKELRRAMLGDCWEYDMRSSVVSWKMGFASRLLKDAGLTPDVRKQFPATSLYLEDKTDFMSTVRYFTFDGNDKPISRTSAKPLGKRKPAPVKVHKPKKAPMAPAPKPLPKPKPFKVTPTQASKQQTQQHQQLAKHINQAFLSNPTSKVSPRSNPIAEPDVHPVLPMNAGYSEREKDELVFHSRSSNPLKPLDVKNR